MSKSEIVRAWKDPKFRAQLEDSGRAAIPASPVGAMGLAETQLRRAAGTSKLTTAWFCTLYTVLSRCCA